MTNTQTHTKNWIIVFVAYVARRFTSIEFFVLFNKLIKMWSKLIYCTIHYEHCKILVLKYIVVFTLEVWFNHILVKISYLIFKEKLEQVI